MIYSSDMIIRHRVINSLYIYRYIPPFLSFFLYLKGFCCFTYHNIPYLLYLVFFCTDILPYFITAYIFEEFSTFYDKLHETIYAQIMFETDIFFSYLHHKKFDIFSVK